MLRDIWKTFNVSLVMVLPLFWTITNNVLSKREKIKYPFVQLVLEYGLIDTFLLKDGKFNGKIYLVFDKYKFNRRLSDTLSKYFSLCELLVDCPYFGSIEIVNDYVIVGLIIPKEYNEDINKIMEGSYSKLSSEYKNEICLKKKISYYPETPSKYAKYIIANDLAYAIAIKDKELRGELRGIIGYDNYIEECYPCPLVEDETITSRTVASSPKFNRILS